MGLSSSKAAGDPWTACQAGALGPLAEWLDSGGNPDAVDTAQRRGGLLHGAAAAGQAECVKLLLQRGANVNLEVDGMGTPLHAAAAHGGLRTAGILLLHGARPEALFQGLTPAELAELHGFSAIARVIRARMAPHHQAPMDAAQDDEGLLASSGGSNLGASSSVTSNAALSDPLLSFVWRVMIKKRPPGVQSRLEASSSAPTATRPPAATQWQIDLVDDVLNSLMDSNEQMQCLHPGSEVQSQPAAEAASQAAAETASQAASLPSDPLLGLVGGAVRLEVPLSFQPTASPIQRSDLDTITSTMLDIRPWEIPYQELTALEFIGSGSFGKVYKAKWRNIVVAVKVLVEERSNDSPVGAALVQRFQEWCPVMASLRHPNVAWFMGMCTSPPAIVTEYCSHGSLHDVLQAAKDSPATLAELSWPRRLRMALGVAEGMLYLHKRGIVHRNLKSPNLLVGDSWRVKVADNMPLNIMYDQKDAENLNPRWQAPEVVNGEEATCSSDVFSWGMVMWELLTLELPWPGLEIHRIIAMIMNGIQMEVPAQDRLPGPDAAGFAGLDDYIALMRRCWAQRPDERPSFHEVVQELRRLLTMSEESPSPAALPLTVSQLSAGRSDGGGKAEVGAEAHLGGAASSAPGGQRPPSPLVAALDAAPAPAAAPVSPVKDQLGGDAAASPQAQMQVGYVPAAAGSTSDGRRPTARPGSSNNAGGTPQGAGPPVSTGPGTTAPAFSDTVPLGIGMPAGSGGGSGSPKPGSPEPSSPQTPGRRVQDSASSHSLLHSLWCCSSDVLLASDRLQGGGSALAVDFRAWSVNFEDLRMQQVIGEGSYGKVYKAKLHETLVAVKVLLDYEEAKQAVMRNALHTITDPIAASLQQECGLMATLRHPNIVQFMGVSTCPPAMVTEYCSRGCLTTVLEAAKQAPLSWPRRLSMALDAAKGMLYLHMRGIVHRDLKSPNLLVEATWRVKVADFNLSKLLGTSSAASTDATKRRSGCWSLNGRQRVTGPPGSARSGSATPSPLVSGTLSNINPRWAAPEVLNGEEATRASDVFSWGVVMWELLTLERPWQGMGNWTLHHRLKNGMQLQVPPRDELPGADTASFAGLDDYIALMRRCLAQRPSERPSFEEVIHELRSLLEALTKAKTK